MSQQRFYIGGFDRSSTKEDLSKLFSKLVNVDYVHVPAATATGLDRNFAIVVATSTEEIAEKCVKSFNGSNWRGCKIRVELAKQYYQDRWRKEKELPAELIQKRIETVTPTVAMIDEAILKRMEKKQVVMKKSPCAPLTTLSMKPIKRVSHRNRLKALKIFFDEEGNAILSESPATSDESGSEDDESTEHIHESTNAVDRESSKGSTTESAKQKSDDKLVKTADFMGSNKILEGGGSRRGFGTLVADPIEKRVDCCIEQDGAKEFLSDDEDIIDTPCINSEDLSEDALAKERERALALFASLKSNVTKISSAHSVTVVSMDDANEEEDVLKTKGGYAQMDKLKNIFYKEVSSSFETD